MLKKLDAAIFSLPVGQLSEVIETKQGFHIIRVLERQDAGKVAFLEAQVKIREKLESEKQTAAFDSHMKKLKMSIPVEYAEQTGSASRTANANATDAGAGSGSVFR